MIVFLNGKFVREDKASISIFDRGFLYGDAVFEGMRVAGGEPFAWDLHMVRLGQGIDYLKLTLPYSTKELRQIAQRLISVNKMPEAMLRMSITRGITGRTYSPRGAINPSVVMTLHPAPHVSTLPRWPVITSSMRLLVEDKLARFKSANKLTQVMARDEADTAGANEAILLNTDGHIAEGTTSNVFWVRKNTVYTPPLRDSALPGITRAVIIQLCLQMKISCREKSAMPREIYRCDGAFLTMSSMGVVEISSYDGHKLPRSPMVKKLWSAYQAMLDSAKG